eukprot:986697-Prymnesium_polylepis.1
MLPRAVRSTRSTRSSGSKLRVTASSCCAGSRGASMGGLIDLPSSLAASTPASAGLLDWCHSHFDRFRRGRA